MKKYFSITMVIILIQMGLLSPVLPSAQVQAATNFYSIPAPGSKYNQPESTIAIRFGSVIDRGSLQDNLFDIVGSISGRHNGSIVLADDQKTIIFKPETPFVWGENVNTTLQSGIRSENGTELGFAHFSFTIIQNYSSTATPNVNELTLSKSQYLSGQEIEKSAQVLSSYATTPSDLPSLTVTSPANETADGYVFFTPGSYLMMADNNGEPVYYKKMDPGKYATDFKKLSNGLLAYYSDGAYHILDNTYNEVKTINAGNGYTRVDIHELQLLSNSDYIYMIFDLRHVDMSQLVEGGDPDALVSALVIQEQDPDGNIVFQWDSFDHLDLMPITDSNQNLLSSIIDYIHSNAIDEDYDGNLLLSSRHMSEITKIGHNGDNMGQILWIMGGKGNQFTFSSLPEITDPDQFYYQHDIRRIDQDHITLFDNHNDPNTGYSRGLEYQINEIAKTAKLVWEYRDTPDIFSGFMGSVQRLPNGNTAIGWGGNLSSNPVTYTEVKPDGSKALELSLPTGLMSYRDQKFTWAGYPTWAPELVGHQEGNGSIDLTFSWNGATNIARYEIFGGNGGVPLQLIGEQTKTGFETSANLSGDQTNYCNFWVLPVDYLGSPTKFSTHYINPSCSVSYLPLVTVP